MKSEGKSRREQFKTVPYSEETGLTVSNSGIRFTNRFFLWLFTLIFVFILGISTEKFVNYFPSQNSSQTQVIINQLKELKKLEVLQANIFAYKTYEDGALLPFNNNEFSVVETGKAIYGLDLSKDISIKISKKNIELNLPEVEIFDLIINPDSIDFIGLKKGFFTNQQDFEKLKKDVMLELFRELKIKANNRDVITQARNNSENLIKSMLKTVGFENIVINFSNKTSEIKD